MQILSVKFTLNLFELNEFKFEESIDEKQIW